MDSVFRLRDKVEELLRRYTALQAENAALKKTLAERDEAFASAHEALRKAETNATAKAIGAAISNPEARAAGRRKLDEVIGEIDKILTTLP